jgi:RNA polymerase sigma-70 factor (ECF subfamily)
LDRNIEERELIKRIIKGDCNSFEKIYNIYSDRLFYFAQSYLGNNEASEETVQEIFVKIWEIRKELNPEKSFSSFLFTITKNCIFNKFKKRKHEKTYAEHLRNHMETVYNKTEIDVYLNETKQIIDNVVTKMPPQRQKIFILSREKGLSYKEISEKLNIGEKTIETHIRLALKTVRKALSSSEIIIPIILTLSLSFLI